MRKLDKKGEKEVMAIYLIFIWIVISIFIISGILRVFASNVDVREDAEAGLLKDRVINCLVNFGELDINKYNSLVSEDDLSLLNVCKIDLLDKVRGVGDEGQYTVNIRLYSDSDNLISEKKFGRESFFATCSKDKNTPMCITRLIYILVEDNGTLVGRYLKISTAVNKVEQNA